jgi:murein L,D-transpeptidase YcbB/YkuD
MLSVRRRAIVPILVLWSMALGCPSQATPPPPQAANPLNSGAVAEQLQAIAAGGSIAGQRWPNFTDYRQQVQQLYAATNYAPVWVRDGRATPQALAVMAALESSRQKGLNPEDYDASRWPLRLHALQAAPGDANTVAHFDAALTVGAMRYISDLHVGRVNPRHFKFGIDVEQKRYDLPQFLAQKLLGATDVPQVLNEV